MKNPHLNRWGFLFVVFIKKDFNDFKRKYKEKVK
jgi:hypothetical protein